MWKVHNLTKFFSKKKGLKSFNYIENYHVKFYFVRIFFVKITYFTTKLHLVLQSPLGGKYFFKNF